MRVKSKQASITVEAVIVLPIYILVILFIINFLNISYLQLSIQQGLNNAGRTLAQYGYVLDVAVGIEKANINNVDEKVATVGTVVDSFQIIVEQISSFFNDFTYEKLTEFGTTGGTLVAQVETMSAALGSINGNDIASYVLTTGVEGGLSMLVGDIVDDYLTEMKVNRNMLACDINYRVCLDDTTNDIVLIATYRYESEIFSMFTDGIDMRQVVVIHPWIGGSTKGVRQKHTN